MSEVKEIEFTKVIKLQRKQCLEKVERGVVQGNRRRRKMSVIQVVTSLWKEIF